MSDPVPSKPKLEQLHDMLHTDQTGLAAGLETVLKTVAGYRWVAEGRGPYEWDDAEYRKEMGHMLDAIHKGAEAALQRWKAGGIPRPCCKLCESPDEKTTVPGNAARQANVPKDSVNESTSCAGSTSETDACPRCKGLKFVVSTGQIGVPCPACSAVETTPSHGP